MSGLVRLYPRAWRARYGDEFAELLEARPPRLRDRLDIVLGAIDARLNPQVPGADDRERSVAGDPAARVVAVATGVLLTIWGVISATSMVPWNSDVEPSIPIALTNLAWVSGALGTFLSVIAFAILIVRYEGVLGVAGVAGAVLTPLGLIMSTLGMGTPGLAALAAGVILFSWRANGRILSTPVAIGFAAGTLVLVASFLLFVAGDGRDVNLMLPAMAIGPSWILFGIGIRKPHELPAAPSPTASMAGA